MNNFDELSKYLANLQFDWQTVAALIAAAVVLYVAFRIGAIILKIVIGLAFIALIIFLIAKFFPGMSL